MKIFSETNQTSFIPRDCVAQLVWVKGKIVGGLGFKSDEEVNINLTTNICH